MYVKNESLYNDKPETRPGTCFDQKVWQDGGKKIISAHAVATGKKTTIEEIQWFFFKQKTTSNNPANRLYFLKQEFKFYAYLSQSICNHRHTPDKDILKVLHHKCTQTQWHFIYCVSFFEI